MKKKKKTTDPSTSPAPPPAEAPAVVERPAVNTSRWFAVLLAFLVLALLVSRFYSLGSQGFHHDESIHCLHSWKIANQGAQTYKYNPVYHGPFLYHFGGLFHSAARPLPENPESPSLSPLQTLLPDEDWVGRLPFVTIGSLFVLSFLLLHRMLGWGTVFLIAAFLTLSPVVNYFSRFARNDAYMTAWLTGMIVCGCFYFSKRKSGWLILVGLFATLSYCTKENSYINTFVPCSFVILWGLVELLRSPRKTMEAICLDFAPCVRFLILFGCFSAFVFAFVALDSRIGTETGLWRGVANILAHSTALTEKIDASALKGETGYFTATGREATRAGYYRLAFGVTAFLLLAFEFLVVLFRKRPHPFASANTSALRLFLAVLFIAALLGSAVSLASWIQSAEREGFLTALFTRMAIQAIGLGVIALLFAIPHRLETRDPSELKRGSIWRETLDWWNLGLTVTLAQTVYLFLFTSMGTNIQRGASAGLYDYIAYWFKHQTGDFRIWGAWWYYLPRLFLYELLPIFLAVVVGGSLFVRGFRSFLDRRVARKDPSTDSILSRNAESLSESRFWKPIPGPLLAYAVYQFTFMAAVYAILNEKVPWLMTYQSFALGLLAALLVGRYFSLHPNTPGAFVGFVWDCFSPPPGSSRLRLAGRGITLAGVCLLLPYTVGQHLTAVFIRPDNPSELLLYTGTTDEFADQIERIREMRREAKREGRKLSIAVEGKSEWPSAWYFRNDDVRWRSVDLSRDVQILDDTPQNRQRMAPNRGHIWEIVPCRLRGWWIWHGTPTALPGRLAFLPNLRAFLFNEKNDQRMSFPPDDRPDERDYSTGFRTQILRYAFFREIWYPSAGEKILVGYRTDEMVSEEESRGYLEGSVEPPRNLAPARVWGATDSGSGEFAQPRGLAFNAEGVLAVSDSKRGRILLLDAEGKTIRTVGEGILSAEVTGPCGVAFDSEGNLFVADTWNHTIRKFSPEGEILASFDRTNQGRVQARLFGPRGIQVGPDGTVYVTDTGNHCVRVFDQDLQLVRTLGEPGSDPGQFKEPVGVAVDPENRLYIADAGNGRIQKLDSAGVFIEEYQTLKINDPEVSALEPHLALLPDGRLAYSFSREDAVWIIDPKGFQTKKYTITPPRLRGPTALAVSPMGRLWVTGRDSGTIAEVRVP